MKKAFSLLCVLCLAICSFAGCSNSKQQNNPQYISFTVTNQVKGSDTQFESHIFCYDLETRALNEVGVVPYNAQYPLTAYDRSANTIYYSASVLEGERQHTGDQLYALDLSTNEAKALTNELYAINYIIPTEKEVILVACPLEASTISLLLFSWNKDTNKLNPFSWDEDLNFSKVYGDPGTGHLTAVGFSASEYDYRLEHQDDTPYFPPDSSVFDIDLRAKTHKELFTFSSGGSLLGTEITSVIGKKDTVIANIKEMTRDEKKATENAGIYSYNFSGNKLGAYPHSEKLKDLEAFVYISPDDRYLYYLAKGQTEGADNALYVYDAVLDKTDIIYESSKNSDNMINNAIVLSDYGNW